MTEPTLQKITPKPPPRRPTTDEILTHIRERGGFISRGKALSRLTITKHSDDDVRVYWSWHIDDDGRIAYDHAIIAHRLDHMPEFFDFGPDPNPNRWQFSEVKGTYT